MTTYFVFEDLDSCNQVIEAINKRKNYDKTGTTDRWCDPHKNQVEEKWIIPFDYNRIGDCKDLLDGYEEIDREEAEKRGWYFGPFEGSLAREREKLEDVHFIYDALLESYGKPNFPATRSLALSFLSACYSLKESLHKKITKTSINEKLGNWWEDKKKEQNKPKELLHEFNKFMNTEKHGGATGGQKSEIKLEPVSFMSSLIVTHHHPHADPQTFRVSSEGAFMTAYQDTPFERRFPVGIHEAKYEIRVVNAPKTHLGQNIENYTFLDLLTLIRNYYMQLLFDAEKELGERQSDKTPTIQFEGNQNLKANN